MPQQLLTFTDKGIYCQAGYFYIDPWQPVGKAVITHGHADHARAGCGAYLCHHDSKPILNYRLGSDARLETVAYGETTTIHGVQVTLYPAGHIPGSAQVKVEYQGEIWVVSGDYKVHADALTVPYEPVKCHAFITECTFGLPVYKWPDPEAEVQRIRQWWSENQSHQKASLLIGYSVGKAQRLLKAIGNDLGPVFTHGSIANINAQLQAYGIPLPSAPKLDQHTPKQDLRQALILAPPSAIGTGWTKRFEPFSMAMASGWMSLRGTKRRKAMDRGFVLSDHVDWPEVNQAIRETEASTIYTTHGYTGILTKWLREQGYEAYEVETQYESEGEEEA